MSASDAKPCRHCGSAILNPLAPTGFCCAGCEQVHGLIVSCGLERYYDLRSEAIAPVNETILGSADFEWLRDAQQAADDAGRRSLRVAMRGLACVGCVWLIERLLSETPGLLAARVGSNGDREPTCRPRPGGSPASATCWYRTTAKTIGKKTA